MSEEYYILSLKQGGDILLWWAPDNKGYTISLGQAGRYSADRVASERSYYDDGVNTKAIPCRLADEAAHWMVPFRSQLMIDWGAVYDRNAPKGRPWPYWPEATGATP